MAANEYAWIKWTVKNLLFHSLDDTWSAVATTSYTCFTIKCEWAQKWVNLFFVLLWFPTKIYFLLFFEHVCRVLFWWPRESSPPTIGNGAVYSMSVEFKNVSQLIYCMTDEDYYEGGTTDHWPKKKTTTTKKIKMNESCHINLCVFSLTQQNRFIRCENINQLAVAGLNFLDSHISYNNNHSNKSTIDTHTRLGIKSISTSGATPAAILFIFLYV